MQSVNLFSICHFFIYRDASWEMEENAFNDLLFRYNRCDAKFCICPKGREFDEQYSNWDIAVCQVCASSGVHVKCGNIDDYQVRAWTCSLCSAVEKKRKIFFSFAFNYF